MPWFLDFIFTMKPISKIALTKRYGRHAIQVLTANGHIVRDQVRKNWFNLPRELPSPEDFAQLKKLAFTTDLQSVVDNAFSVIDELSDELNSWYDNLPEAFQSGEKGDALQEAINQLDSAGAFRPSGIPEALQNIEVYDEPQDGDSRSARAGAAAYELRQAAEALEESTSEDAQSLKDELESAADELESVEFPGMY